MQLWVCHQNVLTQSPICFRQKSKINKSTFGENITPKFEKTNRLIQSQMQIFVKFAENFSLDLQKTFTQNPRENYKQLITFQKFLPEISHGQRKPKMREFSAQIRENLYFFAILCKCSSGRLAVIFA